MLIKSAGYNTSLYKMWFCYKTNNGINISSLGDTLHIENVTSCDLMWLLRNSRKLTKDVAHVVNKIWEMTSAWSYF